MKHDTQPLSIFTNTAGTTADGWVMPLLLAFVLPAFIISAFDSTGNAGEETKNAARNAPLGADHGKRSRMGLRHLVPLPACSCDPRRGRHHGLIFPRADYPRERSRLDYHRHLRGERHHRAVRMPCVIQLTGVRVLWSQARDGQMPAAGFLRAVNSRNVPANATWVCCGIAILFALWSSALAVLTAMVALAWALAYTITVIAGLFAVAQNRLPARPFSPAGCGLSSSVSPSSGPWSFAWQLSLPIRRQSVVARSSRLAPASCFT